MSRSDDVVVPCKLHPARAQAMLKQVEGMRAVSGHGGAPLVGVAELAVQSVKKADVDVQKDLFGGIVITGALRSALVETARLHGRLLFSCLLWRTSRAPATGKVCGEVDKLQSSCGTFNHFHAAHACLRCCSRAACTRPQHAWLSSASCAGGSSVFTGMKDRVQKEVLEIAPQAAKVKTQTAPSQQEAKFSAWLGGSILGCLGSFHQMWMSKQEYAEHGAALIHRKSP